MAINRRMNNRNLTPRTDCEAMCEHLEENTEFCMSGIYSCGSGPGGNCNCTNMGPLLLQYTEPTDLCSWSCHTWNTNHNYWMCLAGCAAGRRGRVNRGSVARGGTTGRNFRTGGPTNRRNSNPDSCIDGMGNSIPCNTGGNVRRMAGMRNMYGKGNANAPLDMGPPCDTDDDCPFPFVCNGTFCYYHRFGSGGGGRRGGGGPRFG